MKKIIASLMGAWLVSQSMFLKVYATTGMPAYMKSEVVGKFQAFLEEYNVLINGVWAFLVMSSVLIFIVHFIKLGHHSGHPLAINKIMNDLMITGVCTALLGGFWLFYFLITRMFL